VPIPGSRRNERIEENLGAADVALTQENLIGLRQSWRRSKSMAIAQTKTLRDCAIWNYCAIWLFLAIPDSRTFRVNRPPGNDVSRIRRSKRESKPRLFTYIVMAFEKISYAEHGSFCLRSLSRIGSIGGII